MNELVKQKWIEALRSGIYTQDRGCLKTDRGFCCLGVLCDLFKDVTIEPFRESVLPEEVLKKAELSETNPSVRIDLYDLDEKSIKEIKEFYKDFDYPFNDAFSLSTLNDELGFTFDHIADIIEEQL